MSKIFWSRSNKTNLKSKEWKKLSKSLNLNNENTTCICQSLDEAIYEIRKRRTNMSRKSINKDWSAIFSLTRGLKCFKTPKILCESRSALLWTRSSRLRKNLKLKVQIAKKLSKACLSNEWKLRRMKLSKIWNKDLI